MATFSLNSPIFECAGELGEGQDVMSYASVHSSIASQQKVFCDKYGQYVVNYAVEWENVLTERISQGLKKANQMRIELDHYEEKVKSIRVTVNVAIAKGKAVDPKLSEKLRRNEEKFRSAKVSYEKFIHALAVLIDEATLRSWKDLHPLLVKMVQFDCTIVKSQAKALSGLDVVVSKLKNFAQEHNIPQSRLKDLQSMNPFELSRLNEQEYLALHASPETNDYIKSENAANESYDVSTDYLGFTSSASPLITQGPQSWDAVPGMGSQHNSNNGTNMGATQNNNPSNNDFLDSLSFTAPSTEEMLTIKNNSVPPPTMESISNATDAISLSNNSSNNYGGNNFRNSMNNLNSNLGNGNNMGNFDYSGNTNNFGNSVSGGYNKSNNFNNNMSGNNNNCSNFNTSNPFSGASPQVDLPRLHAPMPSGPPPIPPTSNGNPFDSFSSGSGNGMYNDGLITPYAGQQSNQLQHRDSMDSFQNSHINPMGGFDSQSNQAQNQQLSLTSPAKHANPRNMSSSTSFDDPFRGF